MRTASVILSATMLALLAVPVPAQTPPANAPASASSPGAGVARDVVRALGGVEALRRGMHDALAASVAADPAGARLPAAQQAALDRALDVEIDARRDRIESELAAIYARNYSYEELRDLLAFLRTPAGRAFALRQGRVVGQSVEWGQAFAREVLAPAIEARVSERR